jgi:CubicO group peptidase (beta-lactamase class C family)
VAGDPAAAHLRRLLDPRLGRRRGELSSRVAAAAALLILAGGAAELLAQGRRDAVASGLLPRIRVEGRDRRFRIEERLVHYRVPGVAVAVVEGGKLDWAAAWGAREAGGGGLDATTPFQVGGVSQGLTALAVLRLAARGALDLDAPVNDALRSWKLPVNALSASRPVTPRLLLRHRAGIGARALLGYGPSETLPQLQDVLEGSALAGTPPVRVEAAPGTGYAPSPGGYAILQKLVEDLAGRSFTRFAGEEILAPLGLADSAFGPLPAALRTRAALGHDALGEPVRGGFSRYPVDAAAGLWSSARDLGVLLSAIHAAHAGAAAAVVPRAQAREMLSAEPPVEAGLGWLLEGEGAARRFRQSGATDGYRSEVVGWLEKGRGAVVLTNGDGGAALAEEVLAAIASVYGWPGLVPAPRRVAALDEGQLARLAGRYELGPHRILEVRVQGAGLRLAQAGSAALTLVPESATRFFCDDPPLEAEFVLDESGAVLGVELEVDGRSLPARRLP